MTTAPSKELLARANDSCELCGLTENLQALSATGESKGVPTEAVVCSMCVEQIEGRADLDGKHWFCLQEAIWSEVAAVQVLGYRILTRLTDEGWASDLLESVYLDEDTLAWAKAGLETEEEPTTATLDSNGVPLANGDAITVTRGLDVKGTNFTAKRGTVVKNIRLSDDPEWIEGRVNGVEIFIKTCYIKKHG